MGFATLPNQVHRKTVKKGFTFTLMVAGECSHMSAYWDTFTGFIEAVIITEWNISPVTENCVADSSIILRNTDLIPYNILLNYLKIHS